MQILFIYEEDLYADGMEMLCKRINSDAEITRVHIGEPIDEILSSDKYDVTLIAKIESFDINYIMPKLQKNNKDMKIVFITNTNTQTDIDVFKQWNLYGLICRKYATEKIESILRLVFGGEKFFPSELITNSQISLSKSQLNVLRLCAQGDSNKNIAYKLNIQESTVKTHISHIMDKLDCPNRICMIRKARSLGLI